MEPIIIERVTLTKVAEYYGNIEILMDMFYPKVNKSYKSGFVRFGIYETDPQPYFLWASHRLNKKLNNDGFNFAASIISNSESLNKHLLENNLAKSLNVRLRDAPVHLSEMMSLFLGKGIFPLFEKYDKEDAMQILTKAI